jgi:hypothetical protein
LVFRGLTLFSPSGIKGKHIIIIINIDRVNDETVLVAVGLRLGFNLCVPYVCHCGVMVDARGLHCFVCKRAPGCTSRHHALNDIVARAFAAAGIPAAKEPNRLTRLDGTCPDRLSLIPFKAGKPLTWDVTVTRTLAASYFDATTRSAGAAAEMAAIKKSAKYANLVQSYIVQSLAFENFGNMNESCFACTCNMGNQISRHWRLPGSQVSFPTIFSQNTAFQCHFIERHFWDTPTNETDGHSSFFYLGF